MSSAAVVIGALKVNVGGYLLVHIHHGGRKNAAMFFTVGNLFSEFFHKSSLGMHAL